MARLGGGRGRGRGQRGGLAQPAAVRPPVARAEPLAARLSRLGLNGVIGGAPADLWDSEPSQGELGRLAALQASRKRRISEANASASGLGSATTHYEAFRRFLPSRTMLMAGDSWQARRHNAESRGLFMEFMRANGSVASGSRAGAMISSTTISAAAASIWSHLEDEQGYGLTSGSVARAGKQQLKHMRKQDGTAGERKLERGLRSAHLAKAAQAGLRWRGNAASEAL